MAIPHEENILEELRANLESRDLVKARLVIASLSGQRKELQRTALQELLAADPKLAVPTMGYLLDLKIGELTIPRLDIAAAAAAKILEEDALIAELSMDAQIHVCTALGDTHDAKALRPLRKLLATKPASANLRFTIYEALSKMHMRASGYLLASGLEDHDASVRIAAARAIERNLDQTLIDGMKNMLSNPAPTPENIVGAVAQSGSLKTLEALLANDMFARLLGDYMEQTPERELIEQLLPVFERTSQHRLLAVAEKFVAAEDVVERPLIYAVDDSPIVLRMYKAALAALHCTIKVFENPFEALEIIDKEPPDFLFTDLNMPEIDGIELASTIRSGDFDDDFPIVMVTTQSYGDDIERAFNSGVDNFIQKPFKTDDLVEVITEMTDYTL